MTIEITGSPSASIIEVAAQAPATTVEAVGSEGTVEVGASAATATVEVGAQQIGTVEVGTSAGPPGPPGPQGPPGDSNAVYSGEWDWTTGTSSAASSGDVGLNASSWATASQLNLNEQKADNTDVTPYLTQVAVGDRFHIRQKTDASQYAEYEVSAVGTDHGTWWSWPITFLQSGGAVPNTPNVAMVVTVLKQGAAASGDKNYIHTQTPLAASWTIVHNLGKYGGVEVVDSGGSVIIPDVRYDSPNQITLTFSAATSGKAYVN